MIHGPGRLFGEKELAACGCGPETRALVAFSGGADSTALLLSMRELFLERRIGGLFAAHLNHGIRGENASRDSRFCEEFCSERDIPLAVETADVPAYAKTRGQSLEQAAREVRYEFLERARCSFLADVIVTAHHRDDQAETVLLHLIRGSGTGGLSGMKPRNGRIVRPMLNAGREEILRYLAERNVSYCEDETNAENGAARNRIRNELLPVLCAYNPNIAEALCRTAALCAEDDAYLAQLSGQAEQEILFGEGLDRAGLVGFPTPIATRILHRRLYALNGCVAESDIRRVLALAQAQTGTKIELPNGRHAWTDARALYLGDYPEANAYEVPFAAEGKTVTPRGLLKSERVNRWQKPRDGNEAYLDCSALPQVLCVRSRRDGDRFYPLGAPGEKKLSDVFIDRKIPKERRDVPLLCAGDDVYYVSGIGCSELAKVRDDTREILHIIYNRGDWG